jgi:uncharacterized protein YcgI (DUF1989 family)
MTQTEPSDADVRRQIAPVICYPTETLPQPELDRIDGARAATSLIATEVAPPRDAASILVPAGHFLRITSVDGPQVGDLNLFAANNLQERFYSGKTRALDGTHLTRGDRMWSGFPYLRPMTTISHDSLEWYGVDPYGGRVHDVIGTCCDPYTGHLLGGGDYHHCCHSNLTRALAKAKGLSMDVAEQHVHDVLNVFMCTGFTQETGQYFMKASPVRPGDYIEFFAEIDLLAVLSACPGGDCGAQHSTDTASCYPLRMDVLRSESLVDHDRPAVNGYDRSHGMPVGT